MPPASPPPDLSDLKLWIACRPWKSDDKPGEAELEPAAYDAPADKKDLAAFLAMHKPSPAKRCQVRDGERTVAVQLVLDVPEGVSRANETVTRKIHAAAKVLRRLAERRRPGVDERLGPTIDRWLAAATAEPEADPVVPFRDEDVIVGSSSEHCAAVLGLVHGEQEGDAWTDLGAALWVAVGPDRYGLRIRAPGRSSDVARVPAPNRPFEVRIDLLLTALRTETDRLDREVARFGDRAAKELATADAASMRDLLGEANRLLAMRATLDRRRRAYLEAPVRLDGWRRQAFHLREDTRPRLEEIRQDLERMRVALIDVPQLVLAAGAWAQAARTQRLSVVAAALVVPGIIAGALGANILPWDDTRTAEAVLGMLLLMAAGGVVAAVVASWGLAPRRPGAWGGLVAVLAVCAGIYGGVLIDDGTKVRPASEPPCEGAGGPGAAGRARSC